MSIGGVQSNQTRAAVAAHLGMKCVLVQEHWVNYDDPVYDRVGNIQLSRMMGADVRLVSDGFDIGIRRSWEEAMESVRQAGGKPYPIPAGCSEHPLGGLASSASRKKCVRRRRNSASSSTTSSCARSRAARRRDGRRLRGRRRADRVIGIDASATPERTHEQITRIARHTAELVDLGRPITAADVVLDTRYAGPEYGLPNDGTLEAIRLCARLEGMLTDPVYEGSRCTG